MTNEEFEFIYWDKIEKIKQIYYKLDLEKKGYIAKSGGKDSDIVSELFDEALPNNKIPRVYANTGIEFTLIVQHVKEQAKKDNRIIILKQTKNIPKTLKEYGYPFKSKEHSLRVYEYNKGTCAKFIKNYLSEDKETKYFKCPKILKYQFKDTKYNYSNKCCYKLKKDLMHQWEKENKRNIVITGMRAEEGGKRKKLTCLTNKETKFHPLINLSEEFINEYIKRKNIKLCKLYYEPYNFKRTGCVGCPFNIKIQEELNTLYKIQPKEYKKALHLWKYVYDEYIRIGYRLKYYPHKKGVQYNIFDYIGEEQ